MVRWLWLGTSYHWHISNAHQIGITAQINRSTQSFSSSRHISMSIIPLEYLHVIHTRKQSHHIITNRPIAILSLFHVWLWLPKSSATTKSCRSHTDVLCMWPIVIHPLGATLTQNTIPIVCQPKHGTRSRPMRNLLATHRVTFGHQIVVWSANLNFAPQQFATDWRKAAGLV